mmetsp:Transcript_24769/g.45406  ORF Transcript_24769/g.45406 Transcript_24769/m.45406 type:complete len:278 (+) Transcript_24769:120-953(+)
MILPSVANTAQGFTAHGRPSGLGGGKQLTQQRNTRNSKVPRTPSMPAIAGTSGVTAVNNRASSPTSWRSSALRFESAAVEEPKPSMLGKPVDYSGDPLSNALDVLWCQMRHKKMSVQDLFHYLDTNHDGGVTRFEIQKKVRKLGVIFGTAELDALMRKFDIDDSGRVELHEFYHGLMEFKRGRLHSEGLLVDRLCGFQIGTRVKCMISKDFPRLAPHLGQGEPSFPEMTSAGYERGTIIGPSIRRGQVMVRFDAWPENEMSVKPRNLKLDDSMGLLP